METNCAEFIKRARREMKLTQEKFADLIGVKRYNLAKYETGAVVPPGDIILGVIAKCSPNANLSA